MECYQFKFKGIVRVILSDPPFKDWYNRFTAVQRRNHLHLNNDFFENLIKQRFTGFRCKSKMPLSNEESTIEIT